MIDEEMQRRLAEGKPFIEVGFLFVPESETHYPKVIDVSAIIAVYVEEDDDGDHCTSIVTQVAKIQTSADFFVDIASLLAKR